MRRIHPELYIIAIAPFVIMAIVLHRCSLPVATPSTAPMQNAVSSSSNDSTTAQWSDVSSNIVPVTFQIPPDWTEQEVGDLQNSLTYSDAEKSITFIITKASAVGMGDPNANGWEGQASVKVEKTEDMVIAGEKGHLWQRSLLAAGLHDLIASVVHGKTVFTFTLRREDGEPISAEQEATMRKILSTMGWY